MNNNPEHETQNTELITILGPTATGKTRLAAELANTIGGEVISADSRQVYRGMNLGTGKDYTDYFIDGRNIPFHLIDIVDAGYEYSVYEYVRDFNNAYNEITGRGKKVILCGGTGMYIEAVLKGYDLQYAPASPEFRVWSSEKTDEELIEMLKSHRALHNVTDTKDRERLLRALEIAKQSSVISHQSSVNNKNVNSRIYGIYFERGVIRKRITERLERRLKEGMIEEVKELMAKGIDESKMKYYGLEYKFIAMYLGGEIDYKTMFEKLNTAIHQFAKRQMTWFRRMERQGFNIKWIDGNLSMEDKLKLTVGSW